MHNFIGFKLFLLLETKVKLLDFLWWRWWQWWYSPKGNFFNPGGSFRQIDCSARCSFLHHLSNPSALKKKVNYQYYNDMSENKSEKFIFSKTSTFSFNCSFILQHLSLNYYVLKEKVKYARFQWFARKWKFFFLKK